MVGNTGSVKPDDKDPKPSGPQAKSLACPSCGAAVTIRCPGNSLSVVCDSCLTILDTHDENVAILTRYFSKTKLYSPKIAFGTRGVLKGKKWECIGFVVRKDRSSNFTWEEYLLFNPYYGYRWLTLNNGHWSLVTTVKRKPAISFPYARFAGEKYRLFYRGSADYVYVLGEFYWRVTVSNAVNDGVLMEDYVNPPYMLSLEKDGREIVWAQSEYLPPKDVAAAFKIKNQHMPTLIGIAPNQTSSATTTWNSMLRTWLLCLVVLTGIQLCHVATSTSALADREGFTFVTNMKVIELTSKKFTLTKPHSLVEINFYAPCDNSWLYVEGDLVDNKTGDTYPIGGSVEYYHGYSDGEYWSEGGNTASMVVPQVPAGEYYVNMDLQSGDWPVSKEQKGMTLTIVNDVPQWSNFWWSVLFVSIAPCWYLFLSYCDESRRWSDSDYSPYASSS